MNRAERLRKVAPSAGEELIAVLAAAPREHVDAWLSFTRTARRDALAEDAAKRAERRRSRKVRDEDDQTAATCRIIGATGKRAAFDPEAMAGLAAFVREASRWMGPAVEGLRRLGYSDREIGDVLGVTQQAVSKRWPRPGELAEAQPPL